MGAEGTGFGMASEANIDNDSKLVVGCVKPVRHMCENDLLDADAGDMFKKETAQRMK